MLPALLFWLLEPLREELRRDRRRFVLDFVPGVLDIGVVAAAPFAFGVGVAIEMAREAGTGVDVGVACTEVALDTDEEVVCTCVVACGRWMHEARCPN